MQPSGIAGEGRMLLEIQHRCQPILGGHSSDHRFSVSPSYSPSPIRALVSRSYFDNVCYYIGERDVDLYPSSAREMFVTISKEYKPTSLSQKKDTNQRLSRRYSSKHHQSKTSGALTSSALDIATYPEDFFCVIAVIGCGESRT